MLHHCPACARTFEVPGFCPFDGKPLVAALAANKQTVLSSFVPAQTDADAQTFDKKSEQLSAQDPTKKVRSVSASESADAAIASFKERASEYDRLVGETLDGRYFVIAKIGEGGMGVVFSAKHAVIERPLAIKVLKREMTRDAATIRRFVQEAKAASRIGHPNIVDVTDFGTTPDGMTYSVMEYVDGITLSKALKHGAPFSAERSIRIASQIARALGAAHDKGIVHRDLKPENVFLIDRDERPDFVKIVDFGIAKVAPLEGVEAGPRLTRAGSVFGTPEYMAPEQAAGRNDTDRRVDIYALGVILYEMLCGRVPHKTDSMVRTLAMVMLDPITPPTQVRPDLAIPKSLEALIMKALSKVREQRFATMAEMLAALDKITRELERPEPVPGLTPLPPGADSGIVTSQAAVSLGPPRRAKPLTRPLHEPEFVTADRPAVFNITDYDQEPVVESKRRWPFVFLGLLIVGGAATGVSILMLSNRDEHAAADHRDAAIVASASDASLVVVEEAADASVVADAQVVAILDAGVRTASRRDAGNVSIVPHPKTVTIQVYARPGNTTIYVGATYRGPNTVRLTEAWGTRYTITCRGPHMRGTAKVVFDGSIDSVNCTAVRVPLCVPGLKNMPDEAPCEDDPNQPTVPDPLSP
jgi:serine/threonine protein kinase